MCGNSSNIHFEGGGRQPSLQPILQQREHDYDRASTGVLPAGRTPIDEQVQLQPVRVSCRRALAEVIIFTTAGGSPARTYASRPGTTRGDSTNLDAPSLRKEIPPQMNFPRRGCLGRLTGGNPYLHRPRGQMCRGSPQTGSKTSGRGMCPGRQTGLPECLQSVSKSAGLPRGGVAILPEGRANVRAHRLHD